MTKGDAILQGIRDADIGDEITIHNDDMTIFCILKVICKEHPESKAKP